MNHNTYIKSLDGFRFLAVFLVLIDHWSGDQVGFPSSYLGVCLFFVLSGFLITGIILNAKEQDDLKKTTHWQSIKNFYIRRTLRIFPLYYGSLLVLYILNAHNVRDKITWLITYTTNIYIAKTSNWLGSIDHLWSLAVEEQFYLFFPFCIFFFRLTRVHAFLWSIIIVSLVLRLLLYLDNQPWVVSYVFMPTCLDAFGIGGLLAYYKIYKYEALSTFKHWLLAFVISLLLYAIALTIIRNSINYGEITAIVFLRFIESLLSITIIGNLIFNQQNIVNYLRIRVFENKFIVYLGQISYGIYIFHNFIYNPYHASETHFFNKVFRKINTVAEGLGSSLVLKIVILLTLVVIIASISFRLIEKPINKLKEKFNY